MAHLPNPHSKRSRRALTVTAVVTIAIALATLQAPSRASAASDHQLRTIGHNIAGGMEFRGDPAALTGVNDQISKFGPDVVMLSEVCGSQVEAFREQHPDWHVHYSEMLSNQGSCDEATGATSTSQGQLLASPYPIDDVEIHDLGHDEVSSGRYLDFTLLCGDVAIPGHRADGLRACVTHLRAGTEADDHEAREGQTENIRTLLRDRIWDQGQAVTVSGDFNALPNWNPMDSMYRLDRDSQYTGAGDFHEADQTDPKYFDTHGPSVTCGERACRTGQRTIGKASKLDYAFISRNVTHGGRVSGLAVDQYGSDHHLYRALFEIQY